MAFLRKDKSTEDNKLNLGQGTSNTLTGGGNTSLTQSNQAAPTSSGVPYTSLSTYLNANKEKIADRANQTVGQLGNEYANAQQSISALATNPTGGNLSDITSNYGNKATGIINQYQTNPNATFGEKVLEGSLQGADAQYRQKLNDYMNTHVISEYGFNTVDAAYNERIRLNNANANKNKERALQLLYTNKGIGNSDSDTERIKSIVEKYDFGRNVPEVEDSYITNLNKSFGTNYNTKTKSTQLSDEELYRILGDIREGNINPYRENNQGIGDMIYNDIPLPEYHGKHEEYIDNTKKTGKATDKKQNKLEKFFNKIKSELNN